MGAHLIECAGNTDPNNFGLMSVADWSGVPLATVVQRLQPSSKDYGVLVSGLDDEAQTARSSVIGASWILPLADLPRLGAFLATGMNGAPLPLAHGAPVRLVVPGWYGCAWMKWVREIRLVGPDETVTSQMAEFAGRTHQDGRPLLARDYEAPVIDLAATPIRVERRRLNNAIHYRIVGIVWGGQTPARALQIRFGSRDAWKPLELCPAPDLQHGMVAVELSMDADRAGCLQHRDQKRRHLDPHATARHVLLRAPGEDRRRLGVW